MKKRNEKVSVCVCFEGGGTFQFEVYHILFRTDGLGWHMHPACHKVLK